MKRNIICCLMIVFMFTGCAQNFLSFDELHQGNGVVVTDDNTNNTPAPEEQPQSEPANKPSSKPSQPVVNNVGEGLTITHSGNEICFDTDGEYLTVKGNYNDGINSFLSVIFDKNGQDMKKIDVSNKTFDSKFEIPQSNGEVLVELYAGEQEYGYYESIIIDFIRLEKTNGKWEIMQSPIYDWNVSLFNKPRVPDEFLSANERIQSDDGEIIKLAKDITSGVSDDMGKAKAIHDWIAENIYYDMDVFMSGTYGDMDAISVLKTKKSVCEGYANLYAALARCCGIPCRVQGGFALGIGETPEWTPANVQTTQSNHAWNEVYIDGRWILVDSTWDSPNKYQNGQYEKGKTIKHIFFDSTMEFFSLSHKLID